MTTMPLPLSGFKIDSSLESSVSVLPNSYFGYQDANLRIMFCIIFFELNCRLVLVFGLSSEKPTLGYTKLQLNTNGL